MGGQKKKTPADTYFKDRYDMMYYQYMFYIVRVVGRDAESVIDVGSNRCDYLNWMWWIENKTSLDLKTPLRGGGVKSIKENFITWAPDKYYDLVLCLQTLEHISEVNEFSQKLISVGRHLIVSVPFEWPVGTKYHVNDPVSHEKLENWMQRKPNYSVVVEEPFPSSDGKSRRLVAYYDTENPNRKIGRSERKKKRPIYAEDADGETDGA